MSQMQLELDPVAVRQELERQRTRGVPFDQAWKVATNYRTANDCEPGVYSFMRKHFEAAYNGTAKGGRCMVPRPDTSSAVPVRRFVAHAEPPVSELKATNDHERCRSGDGCDRLATRGRLGKMWCEYHSAELERITASVKQSIGRLDPRKATAAFARRNEAA